METYKMRYFEIAQKRIADAQAQMRMPLPEPPAARQRLYAEAGLDGRAAADAKIAP